MMSAGIRSKKPLLLLGNLFLGRPGGLLQASLRYGFFGRKGRKELNPAHPWRGTIAFSIFQTD
jgi:hypothetical protein